MPEKKYTFCRICEAACGLIVEVENNRIINISPNPDHLGSRGFACKKGLKFDEILHSPDRITAPMKRKGDSWEEISWKQALKEIGGKLRELKKAHGPHSIAAYVGNGAGFSLLHPMFVQGFLAGLGTRNAYASSTQDCSNKFAVAEGMYGFPMLQPIPDFENSQCLIIVGANPVISKFSFKGVPRVLERMKRAAERGLRIVSVNPRRTETVKTGAEHLPIRPGTDVFFLLAFAARCIERGYIREERVRKYMTGFEAFKEVVLPWTAEAAERVTGIPAEKIRELADFYGKAKGAALYCSTGINQSKDGTLAFWLMEVINAVSGNLDRRGGTLVGEGILDFPRMASGSGSMGAERTKSRIGGFSHVSEALPGAILADEILTPGEEKIRALIVTAGNPLLSLPDTSKVERALKDLELLVSVDIFRSNTGDLADYILPGITFMEHPDINFIFQSMLGIAGDPVLSYSDTVIHPGPEQKEETWIFTELARAAGVSLFGSAPLKILMEIDRLLGKIPLVGTFLAMNSVRFLRILLRASKNTPSLGYLRKHPEGVPLPPPEPNSFLGKRVLTEEGKVNLAPSKILQLADTLEKRFREEMELQKSMKMVNKRETLTHNSYFQNAPSFVAGEKKSNYLYIHPRDAASRDLRQGDRAEISTDVGSIVLPVKITEEMSPGAVAAPWGWGHSKAKGLSTAGKTEGANINVLTPSGPGAVDPVSGMAHLTAFPVEVKKAPDTYT